MNDDRLSGFLELCGELYRRQNLSCLVAAGWGFEDLRLRVAMAVDACEDYEIFQYLCHLCLTLIYAEEYCVAIPCKVITWRPGEAGSFRLATCAAEVETLFVMATTYSEQGVYFLKFVKRAGGRGVKLCEPPEKWDIEPKIYDLLPHGALPTTADVSEISRIIERLGQRLCVSLASGDKCVANAAAFPRFRDTAGTRGD